MNTALIAGCVSMVLFVLTFSALLRRADSRDDRPKRMRDHPPQKRAPVPPPPPQKTPGTENVGRRSPRDPTHLQR